MICLMIAGTRSTILRRRVSAVSTQLCVTVWLRRRNRWRGCRNSRYEIVTCDTEVNDFCFCVCTNVTVLSGAVPLFMKTKRR